MVLFMEFFSLARIQEKRFHKKFPKGKWNVLSQPLSNDRTNP